MRVSRFGDGYEQRVADGINTAMDKWDLTFTARTDTEASGIQTFLKARAGFESFDWTPTGESTAVKVVCREWNRTFDKFNLNTVTATFERVYE